MDTEKHIKLTVNYYSAVVKPQLQRGSYGLRFRLKDYQQGRPSYA